MTSGAQVRGAKADRSIVDSLPWLWFILACVRIYFFFLVSLLISNWETKEIRRIPRISFVVRGQVNSISIGRNPPSNQRGCLVGQVKCMTYHGNWMTTTNRIYMNYQSFGTLFNIYISSNGFQFSDKTSRISPQVDWQRRDSPNFICCLLFRQAPEHVFEVFLEIHAPIGHERKCQSNIGCRGKKREALFFSTSNINTVSEWFLRWDSQNGREFRLSMSHSFVRRKWSFSITFIPVIRLEMNRANTLRLSFWTPPAPSFVSAIAVDPIENPLVYVWLGTTNYQWVPRDNLAILDLFSSR